MTLHVFCKLFKLKPQCRSAPIAVCSSQQGHQAEIAMPQGKRSTVTQQLASVAAPCADQQASTVPHQSVFAAGVNASSFTALAYPLLASRLQPAQTLLSPGSRPLSPGHAPQPQHLLV